jgi:hypothetical protein
MKIPQYSRAHSQRINIIRSAILAVTLIGASSGCMSDAAGLEGEDVSTTEQKLAFVEYIANYTNSATDVNATAQFQFYNNSSQAIMIGTQGISGSSYNGDTYLRLKDPYGTEVASNDNSCGTLGSRLYHTPSYYGTYTLWAGCALNGSCGSEFSPNIVAISRRLDQAYFSTSNTNNAAVNTFNKQYYFNSGETIRVSTCSNEAGGAYVYSGNTYLRLYLNNAGAYSQITSNDDAGTCGCGTASLIKYTVTAPGYYQVRAGCYQNTSCSGYIAVYKE